MKFAIIGGTHGNEPVGIKVVEQLKNDLETLSFSHDYQTFIGNPEAQKIQKRYVDSDLNRAFGPHGQSKGYETNRSQELTEKIKGHFDFILDLHTTTSNMGLTVILTRTDELSLKAACFLQQEIPELKIIVSMRAGEDCPYTSSLAPSALTVEVGPVANNVVATKLVKATYSMVTKLLNFDFKKDFNYKDIECYHVYGVQPYPEESPEGPSNEWMIDDRIDGHDFCEIKSGDVLFTTIHGEVIKYEGDQVISPLFINEAAYQENNTAMEVGLKKSLAEALS